MASCPREVTRWVGWTHWLCCLWRKADNRFEGKGKYSDLQTTEESRQKGIFWCPPKGRCPFKCLLDLGLPASAARWANRLAWGVSGGLEGSGKQSKRVRSVCRSRLTHHSPSHCPSPLVTQNACPLNSLLLSRQSWLPCEGATAPTQTFLQLQTGSI